MVLPGDLSKSDSAKPNTTSVTTPGFSNRFLSKTEHDCAIAAFGSPASTLQQPIDSSKCGGTSFPQDKPVLLLPLEHFLWCAPLNASALLQNQHFVAKRCDFIRIVADVQHRDAKLIANTLQVREQPQLQTQVQTGQ